MEEIKKTERPSPSGVEINHPDSADRSYVSVPPRILEYVKNTCPFVRSIACHESTTI